ncbi:MAG: hypothetical protein AB1758_04330 [Candidatus Eremiobacterota bacterium]
MLQRLSRLDRRLIFLIIALAVTLPFLFPLGLPVTPSSPARGLYDAINKLPPNSLVLMSFDYGPSTAVELEPMARAGLRQCFRRGHRVVAMCISPEGALQSRNVLTPVVQEMGKERGVHWVNLGYKAGADKVLRSLGSGFPTVFLRDIDGTPINQLPLMSDVKDWSSFALVLDWSSGYPGALEYIKVVASTYKRPLAVGVTAVSAPEFYPYLNSGQLEGMLGGLRGAAEYELLVKEPGTATLAMDAQSVAHFTLAGFIVFSNVVYFLERRRRRR